MDAGQLSCNLVDSHPITTELSFVTEVARQYNNDHYNPYSAKQPIQRRWNRTEDGSRNRQCTEEPSNAWDLRILNYSVLKIANDPKNCSQHKKGDGRVNSYHSIDHRSAISRVGRKAKCALLPDISALTNLGLFISAVQIRHSLGRTREARSRSTSNTYDSSRNGSRRVCDSRTAKCPGSRCCPVL
jgi:hypothetical protein